MKRLSIFLLAVFSAVLLRAQCTAAFTYTNSGNVFTFTDASTTGSGTINGWLWTFGDQTNPSTQQNPSHTYIPCGYFVVTLNISTTNFCFTSFSDTIFTNTATAPSYTYTVDTTNGTVQFTASPNSSLLNYSWNFGDSTTGTGQNPTHQYASSGTYVVCLTTSDTGAVCVDSICDTVNVYIAPPNCSATFTTNTVSQGNILFTAAPFNNNWNYSWDFGDASTGNGFVVNHQYTTADTFLVCLTVTDSANSCSSVFCDSVIIPPFNCSATWNNTPGLNPGDENFTATPFTPGWNYAWDFGDATTGNGIFVQHTYTASGTYTVCLTITDPATTCSSVFCDTVNIVLPTACPPTFTANGFNGIYAFTAAPFNLGNTYTWDFGDGSPLGNGVVTAHTYTLSGTYTVCLTMTTSGGCTGTFCDTINVVISGIENAGAVPGLELFPNPAGEKITVKYVLENAANVQLEIVDISGRVLRSMAMEKTAGLQQEEISLGDLAPGTYLLRMKTENASGVLRFVKQ